MLAVGAAAVIALVLADADGEDQGGPEEQAEAGAGTAPGETAETGGTGEEGGELAAWTAPTNDSTARGDVIRTLAAGPDLIVVTQHEITSIDRATGEKNWITDMSAAGEPAGQAYVLCGASTTASDDMKLAVTMGFDEAPSGEGDSTIYSPVCGLVVIVDLATGEFGASMQVAFEGGGTPNPGLDKGMPVEIVGDTVITGWYATIFGLDIADLSIEWQHMLGSERGWEDFDCSVDDLARGDGENVVVMNTCISDVGETPSYFDELSTTGQIGRSHEVTPAETQVAEISSLQLVSATPIVVHVVPNQGSADGDALVTLDDSWNVLSVIQDERMAAESPTGLVVTDIGYLDGLIGAWRQPNRSLVAGTTLVSFTPPNTETPNALVAVDLATGQDLWSVPAPDGYKFWQVISVADGAVVAVLSQDAGPGQAVVTVDLASGEEQDRRDTEVFSPGDDEFGPSLMASHAFVHADDRAYAVEYGEAGDEDDWMAFSIG